MLKIDYSADGEIPRMLNFLEQSPLQEQINVDLSEFVFAGAAHTEGSLVVPLGSGAADLTLDGLLEIPAG